MANTWNMVWLQQRRGPPPKDPFFSLTEVGMTSPRLRDNQLSPSMEKTVGVAVRVRVYACVHARACVCVSSIQLFAFSKLIAVKNCLQSFKQIKPASTVNEEDMQI